MADEANAIIQGTAYVSGAASGQLIACDTELSFWGGVHPVTAEVIDRSHPLSGQCLKDAILAIPGGRGSCSGSATILELILSGAAPKALLFARPDHIVTLGVVIAEEVFGKAIPVVLLGEEGFRRARDWHGGLVYVGGGCASNGPLRSVNNDAEEQPAADVSDFSLSKDDRATLNAAHGESTRVALKVIIRMARMMGAQGLIDVNQAHVDGAFFGPGSLAFAEKMHAMGGKFRVPTTVNALTVDLKRWRALGVDNVYGQQCDELARLFLEMGAKTSFTCAPYMLDRHPSSEKRWRGESLMLSLMRTVCSVRERSKTRT